jgi:hypothetical protein
MSCSIIFTNGPAIDLRQLRVLINSDIECTSVMRGLANITTNGTPTRIIQTTVILVIAIAKLD